MNLGALIYIHLEMLLRTFSSVVWQHALSLSVTEVCRCGGVYLVFSGIWGIWFVSSDI